MSLTAPLKCQQRIGRSQIAARPARIVGSCVPPEDLASLILELHGRNHKDTKAVARQSRNQNPSRELRESSVAGISMALGWLQNRSTSADEFPPFCLVSVLTTYADSENIYGVTKQDIIRLLQREQGTRSLRTFATEIGCSA